nr:DUF4347 domain-containing protein [Pseudomonas sp.]
MSSISREIAFVINNLPDVQTLLAGIAAGTPVHLLDAEGDALAQMAAILADYQGLDAIHLFSHGSQGALHIGTTTLDQSTLNTHATTLADIGAALGENGDILLYGSNVAAGQVGVDFVQRLAQATQADIAASNDLTGAASLGGNWTLEQTLGQLATAGLLNPAYRGVLVALPEIADADGTLAYTEGAAATAIDSTLTLSDADDTHIESATVTISTGYVSSEDVLGFTNQNDISGSWNSGTGVLTLTGSATKMQYEAALESVTYRNTNTANPNTGNRTVTWVISDGDLESDEVTSTITVTAGNQAPVLKLPSILAFADKVDYTTGVAPNSVSSADVNGDGRPDLLVANKDDDTVSVLTNHG